MSQPLVAIIGPTASGKTDLALRLADHLPLEIICADSRTIYRGLDLGTAKPSPAEQARVPHHGLDLVTPDQPFSAASFQALAQDWLVTIRQRQHLPVVVGGTGLYVESLLYNFTFAAPADPNERARLEALNTKDLQQLCLQRAGALPANRLNRRHLVRAIERAGQAPPSRQPLTAGSMVVGLNPGREELRRRIEARAHTIFAADVVAEAQLAADRYGWDAPGLSGNIYPILRSLKKGEISRQVAIEHFITADWQLARRQMTWWRRNQDVQWFSSAAAAAAAIYDTMNKNNDR